MIRLALIAWLALCGVANAQLSGGVGGFPGPGTVHSAGASYQGPGDIVSGAYFWGSCSRGYNAADTANACNVCLPSDTTCADITLTNGFAVLPGSLSTCNITTVICTVKTVYDKSGSARNATMATEANRPTFRPAMASNGCPTTTLPCMLLTAANSPRLVTGAVFTFTQPFTVSVVYSSTPANGDIASIGGAWGLIRQGANTVRSAAGGALDATASDNAFHAGQFIVNGASSASYIDGSNTTGNAGAFAPSSANLLFGGTSFSAYCTCTIAEIGVWSSAFGTGGGGQASLMTTNQRSSAYGYNF